MVKARGRIANNGCHDTSIRYDPARWPKKRQGVGTGSRLSKRLALALNAEPFRANAATATASIISAGLIMAAFRRALLRSARIAINEKFVHARAPFLDAGISRAGLSIVAWCRAGHASVLRGALLAVAEDTIGAVVDLGD